MKRLSIKKFKNRTTKEIFIDLTESIKKKLQARGKKRKKYLKILKGIEKLATDANPILSAIIGGNARAVFLTENIVFYTTAFNFKEVERYIPILASRRKIPVEDLYMVLSMLPLFVCDTEFYKNRINHARRLIEKRDPKDAHLLALDLKLDCPIWSNDRDFEGLGVKVYSTMELMRG